MTLGTGLTKHQKTEKLNVRNPLMVNMNLSGMVLGRRIGMNVRIVDCTYIINKGLL